MLKANSKKAKENLKKYIEEDRDYIVSEYTLEELNGAELIDKIGYYSTIWAIFEAEKPAVGAYARMTTIERFEEWASGLALGGLFCYYYNRPAVDDLGDILEETEEERNRYTEEEATRLLTSLIFRTINEERTKEAKKNGVTA